MWLCCGRAAGERAVGHVSWKLHHDINVVAELMRGVRGRKEEEE